MSLNSLVASIFQGIKEEKEKSYYPRKFQEMQKTNLLFEVDDLMDMVNHARNKEELNHVLDHLYRFDAPELGEFGYYKEIERKIIERMW